MTLHLKKSIDCRYVTLSSNCSIYHTAKHVYKNSSSSSHCRRQLDLEVRFELAFKSSYYSRSSDSSRDFILYLRFTEAERMLTKLNVHVRDLKKLAVRTAQSTSRPTEKQNVIKVNRLMCSQDVISQHSNFRLNSWKYEHAQWRSIPSATV